MIENIQKEAIAILETVVEFVDQSVDPADGFNFATQNYTDEELMKLLNYMAQSCRMRGQS